MYTLQANRSTTLHVLYSMYVVPVDLLARSSTSTHSRSSTAMLTAGLVDKIYWTQSQHILGDDARPVVGALKLVELPPQNLYTLLSSSSIGQDQLHVFVQDVNQGKAG